MKQRDHNAKKEANPKSQSEKPAEQWGPILRGTVQKLYDSWLQGFLLGVLFLLLTLVVGWFVKSPKSLILTSAVGLTVMIWIVAAIAWREVDKKTSPGVTAPLLEKATEPGRPGAATAPTAQKPNHPEQEESPKTNTKPAPGPRRPQNEQKGQSPTADTKTPPFPQPPRFQEKREKLLFSLGEGGITVVYTLAQLEAGPADPFDFGGFKPVRVYLENRKFYADVTVYGGPGQAPIEIKKNEFAVRPPNWDRNFSESAFEVVDDNLRPVFQFIQKTPSHIVVNGIFPYPGGLILANEFGMLINPTIPTTFRLRRIFKYPSWKYLGQYE